MYIRSVISNLGAWEKLEEEHPDVLTEITHAINKLGDNLEYEAISKEQTIISTPSIYKSFRKNIKQFNWNKSIRLKLGTAVDAKILSEIDFEKDSIGVDLFFGKSAFLESYLFAKIPFFIKASKINIAVIIIPTKDLEKQVAPGIVKFENIQELLTSFNIFPLKYPFVIIGISDQSQKRTVTKLNSAIDLFLINKLGKSLNEILVRGEAQSYDFKAQMPENQKVAQEACGFANLESGGLLIFGIGDDSTIHGIEPTEWDTISVKLTSIISSACRPVPRFKIHRFETPESSDKILIILEIFELKHKPCMSRDRVYIRKSATVRPATTDDIRRMLIR